MEIVLDTSQVVGIAGVITALGVIFGVLWSIFKQYNKWEEYDKRISKLDNKMLGCNQSITETIEELRTDTTAKMQNIMAEQCLQTEVLDAVLDGLEQLGCNHSVPRAREKLNKFVNEQAHRMDF